MTSKFTFDPLGYESSTFRNEGGKLISKVELSTVRNLLRYQEKGLVLDVGVGTGRILRTILRDELTLVGVDSNQSMVKHLAGQLRSSPRESRAIDLVVADGQHLPFRSGAFVAVTCIRVARYFRQPSRAVDEICSLLRPNGRVVLEFANFFQPRAVLQLSQVLFKGHAYPHLFRLSSMRRLLESRGIMVDRIIGWHKFPPGILVQVNSSFLVKFIANLETILQRTTPVELFSRSVVISGLKVPDSVFVTQS